VENQNTMLTFEVTSGELVISDPCYEVPTWCAGTVKAKNGTWGVDYQTDDMGDRITEIWAYSLDAAVNRPHIPDELPQAPPLPFINGVDSGQLGYFDRNHYRNNDSARELAKHDFGEGYDREPGDEWYRAACAITLSSESFGVMPHGVVSSSGWGDGSYNTQGIFNEDGECIGLRTVFIEEDYTDDEDDWWNDEEETPEEEDDEDNDEDK
jgi:Protein of unknown function (DUF4241)